MNVRIASVSECGSRDYNEDSVGSFVGEDCWCLVLADGLGGHGKGEVASQTAVDAVRDVFFNEGNPEVSGMIEAAQAAVTLKQKENNDFFSMKTTLTTVLIDNENISWGHVGDSRIYFFRKNKLISRTLDHSVPQMLVNAGEIKDSEIRGHVDRNKLLRVVGTKWDSPRYDLSEKIRLIGAEAVLMCSDGFWEYIEDKQMVKLLKKASSPEEWLENMKAVVLKNGAGCNMDNFSAVCAFIEND